MTLQDYVGHISMSEEEMILLLAILEALFGDGEQFPDGNGYSDRDKEKNSGCFCCLFCDECPDAFCDNAVHCGNYGYEVER